MPKMADINDLQSVNPLNVTSVEIITVSRNYEVKAGQPVTDNFTAVAINLVGGEQKLLEVLSKDPAVAQQVRRAVLHEINLSLNATVIAG